MLVVTRKPGEAIQIGPDIRVMVCRVHGQEVRLGIEAPDDVAILRDDAGGGPRPKVRQDEE